MSDRPRPLSSQPKRSWGDDRPAFELTEDDWPPSPDKKRVAPPGGGVGEGRSGSTGVRVAPIKGKDSFSGSVSSHSANTSAAWSNTVPPGRSNAFAPKPLAAKPSFTSKAPSASKPEGPMAPMFRQNRPGASSSSSSLPSRTASSARSAASAPVVPKKKERDFPWDNISQGSSKSSSTRSGSSSNFHTVGGASQKNKPPSTGSRSSMLTSNTLDIKQKVILSPEQQMVLKLVVEDGKNVFFTGSAGTGKSVLLREIITSLKRKYSGRSDAVAVTASTGMAACNIGGTTIHSFSGIGLGIEDAEVLVNKVKKNRVASGKWSRTQVLVIDEVSMVDGFLFDKLAAIATALKRKPGVPFGGIQLVVTGDFFQLPPVAKGVATFAFEAKAWKNSIQHTVNLTQVFRQKDTEFIDMLNEMRFGTMTAASIAKFRALARDPVCKDGTDPTELFPTRNEVDKSNQARLNALDGPIVPFLAEDWPNDSSNDRQNTYLANFMAPKQLELKIGAQVMLIKNMDATLVNGTIGKVVAFGFPELDDGDADSSYFNGKPDPDGLLRQAFKQAAAGGVKADLPPVIEWRTPAGIERMHMAREEFKVEDAKGVKLASRKQYPIILAWAMSIHKSQGQTLPNVKVDLGKVFEKGQSYVALSRATCLEGLQVLRFDPKKVEAHPKVVNWSKSLEVLS